MEGTNYQDELNNFIMSRAAKGPNNNNNLSMNLPTSGLTSANNSNRQAQKNNSSSNINTNRFQYMVSKFDTSELITPSGTIP
jgi:hypothetical protein